MKRKVSGASCGDSQIKEESETRRKKHQNLGTWKVESIYLQLIVTQSKLLYWGDEKKYESWEVKGSARVFLCDRFHTQMYMDSLFWCITIKHLVK